MNIGHHPFQCPQLHPPPHPLLLPRNSKTLSPLQNSLILGRIGVQMLQPPRIMGQSPREGIVIVGVHGSVYEID